MVIKSDDLCAAADELERVLGQGAAGAAGQQAVAERALLRLEEIVRRHAGSLYNSDGLVTVDRPRLPSPGVDRQTAELRQQLESLVRDLQELRSRVPAAGPSGAGIDHASLVARARQLAEALRTYEDREAHVILESVNTDIGAGD